MEYTPPPFFRQGPSALARLVAFSTLSVALLVLDARYKVLERVRFGVATVLYPMQRAARFPGEAASGASGYMERQRQLIEENARLKQSELTAAQRVLRAGQVEGENTNLRALLAMRERLPVIAVAAETLYEARDPFTRKVTIDRGLNEGVHPGQVVVDGTGVMGQVTRSNLFVSEVSLLTDRDQAIPVQVLRNGLRAIAYGTPGGAPGGAADTGSMELRFLAANADVREGDVLVTSGIDGTYLPGLPVASVTHIEREAGYAFAKIVCKPAAGIDRFGQVLVLMSEAKLPAPLPPEIEEKSAKGKPKRRPENGADAAPMPVTPARAGGKK
jgi:rod shape-determining protein MreC